MERRAVMVLLKDAAPRIMLKRPSPHHSGEVGQISHAMPPVKNAKRKWPLMAKAELKGVCPIVTTRPQTSSSLRQPQSQGVRD